MLFCGGTREGGAQGRREFNLNEEGQKLFVNAIEYMIGNLVREPWVKAWQPDPADSAVNVALPLLRWIKGETAVAHDVYFGVTPDLTAADLIAARITVAVSFPPASWLRARSTTGVSMRSNWTAPARSTSTTSGLSNPSRWSRSVRRGE